MLMNNHISNHHSKSMLTSQTRIGRGSARRTLAGIAVASGLAAVGWGLDLSPIDWLMQTALAASKKATSQEQDKSPDEQKPAETRIKLNYFSASWPRVFQ